MSDLDSTVRTFLALPVCACLADGIAAFRAGAEPTADFRWIPRKNWHLTVRFLGMLDRTQIEHVKLALDSAVVPEAFPVSGGDLQGFPGSRPTVLAWLPDPCPKLDRWVAEIDPLLDGTLNQSRDRPFKPHVSLARGTCSELKKFPRVHLRGTLHVRELVLYGSKLSSSGSRYFRIQTWG